MMTDFLNHTNFKSNPPYFNDSLLKQKFPIPPTQPFLGKADFTPWERGGSRIVKRFLLKPL